MIQSGALSQRPDHCPTEDNDNEDMVLLPDNLFIELIDVDLQERIANIDTMDKDAETALLLLLNGKLAVIGHWKNMATAISFSTKKRTIFLETTSCERIF